jgi:hypothetical protein
MTQEVQGDRIARLVAWQDAVQTDEGREEFLQKCSKARSVDAVCTEMDLPRDRVVAFLAMHAELDGAAKRALESYAHARMSEIIEIVDRDSPYVQRDRLRMNGRALLAQFYAPRTYAPRQEVTHELGQSFTEALLEISRRRMLERPIETQPTARVIDVTPEQADEGEI